MTFIRFENQILVHKKNFNIMYLYFSSVDKNLMDRKFLSVFILVFWLNLSEINCEEQQSPATYEQPFGEFIKEFISPTFFQTFFYAKKIALKNLTEI